MYDIHQISDKPILLEPPQQDPRPSQWISRVAELLSVVALLSVLAYLLTPLLFGDQSSGCDYSGDIPLEEAFRPIYDEHCLTLGAPISRAEETNLDGYGPRIVQYFEGALLTVDLAGNAATAEAFPLGSLAVAENSDTTAVSDADQALFDQYWAENGSNDFLGERLTDLVQVDDSELIYFENGSLIWDSATQRLTPHPLGRMHLYSNNPQFMIGVVNIPEDRVSGAFGAVPEYDLEMVVQHPVLYSGDQQIVTVRVLNTIEDSPAVGGTLNGNVYFEDVGDTLSEAFVLSATEEPGVYTAVVNLPSHPNGNAGRDVIVNVSYRGNDTNLTTTVKKFQTWW